MLDAPDTAIEGTFLGEAYQWAIPADDVNETEQQWVFTNLYYMGQDIGANLSADMCGSAIRNEEGQVVGLFRLPLKIASCGIGASVLRPMRSWPAEEACSLIPRDV